MTTHTTQRDNNIQQKVGNINNLFVDLKRSGALKIWEHYKIKQYHPKRLGELKISISFSLYFQRYTPSKLGILTNQKTSLKQVSLEFSFPIFFLESFQCLRFLEISEDTLRNTLQKFHILVFHNFKDTLIVSSGF